MSSQQDQPFRSGQPCVPGSKTDSRPFALPDTDPPPAGASPPPGSPPARARAWRTPLATGLSALLIVTLGVSSVFSSQPRQVLVAESFQRPNAPTWGTPAIGRPWVYPSGPGVAIAGGRGVVSLAGRGGLRQIMQDTAVRDVSVQFDVSLDQLTGGTGVQVMAVLRQSKAGMYQARVRIGRAGRLWLSVVKLRHGSTRQLGKPVLLPRSHYRAGRSLTVRAQAIKQSPTQIRMKVWPTQGNPPRHWQLVRNDRRGDLRTAGRTGLRTQITRGAARPNATVRFDNVRVARALDSQRLGSGAAAAAAPRAKDTTQDTTKPKLTRLTTAQITETSAVIHWSLNEPVTGFVQYGRTKAYTDRTGQEGVSTDHESKLPGLAPGTTYHYRVVSADRAGNQKVSRDMTFNTQATSAGVGPDPTPVPTTAPQARPAPTPAPVPTRTPAEDTAAPTFLDISIRNLTETTAEITWSLDENATGYLEYGTTPSYGSMTKKETSFDYTTHIQTIRRLDPGVQYHFRAVSTDRSSNTATSSDRTFTTVGAPAVSTTPNPTPTSPPAPATTPKPTPAPTPTPTPTPIRHRYRHPSRHRHRRRHRRRHRHRHPSRRRHRRHADTDADTRQRRQRARRPSTPPDPRTPRPH